MREARACFVSSVHELDTPAVLVDRRRLERNIATYAAIAAEAGIALRPHVKTHKTLEIARLQLAAGSPGITVAKLSEAEVYLDAGVEDIFVAYPIVGELKWQKAAKLSTRGRLTVGADSVIGVRGLARAAQAAESGIGVRLELDSGLRRSGVSVERLTELCAEVMRHPPLRLDGIFTFRSSAYPGSAGMPVADMGTEEGQLLASAAERLREQGFPIRSVSGGSTPTARSVARVPGVTEIRPGTYVFQDLMSRADGACTTDDLALSVLTTVVSRPSESVAIVDAGSKTLAGDAEASTASVKGYGEIYGGGGYVAWLNEEHGAVQLTGGWQPDVTDRLRIFPAHVCTVTNLADELIVIDGDQVTGAWPVTARGCNR